jgi:aquaporin related protein
VVTGVFDLEHWIYWVGPALGTIIAVVFYQFIKILEYEVANPGQDDNEKDLEVKVMRERSASPDLEMGIGNAGNGGGGAASIGGHGGGGAASIGGHGGGASIGGVSAHTIKDVMERKAKKWEGQGFGGRGADTY